MTALVVSEARVPVGPYQQVSYSDLDAIGTLPQGSLDNVVENILIAGVGYTGMGASQVGTSNIVAVQPGYLIKGGPAYSLRDAFNVDVTAAINSVPDSAKTAIVAIVADGQEFQTTETRTFVDASKLPTDPTTPAPTVTQATPTRVVRAVVISSPQGAADVQPSAPAFSPTLCLIATVVVSNTAIVSVRQNTATQITRLDQLAPVVAALNSEIGTYSATLQGILGTIASLAATIASKFASEDAALAAIQARLTALEQRASTPAGTTSLAAWIDYFSDFLQLQPTAVGASGKVGSGLTFAGAGGIQGLTLYYPVSPNLKVNGNRFLSPSYSEWSRFYSDMNAVPPAEQQTPGAVFHSLPTWSVGLNRARFGRLRVQAGPSLPAGNPTQLKASGDPNVIWSQDGTGVGYDPTVFDWRAYSPELIRQAGYWSALTGRDNWGLREALPATGVTPALVTTFVQALGASVSEIEVPLIKGTTGDVRLLICRDLNGDPDPNSVLADVTAPYASIGPSQSLGQVTADFLLPHPIMHEAGQTYHYVLLCSGDHQLFYTQNLLTKFYSNAAGRINNNGIWYPIAAGNLGFSFAAHVVTPTPGALIEFNPITLAGGIDVLDFLAAVVLPRGCPVDLRVKINGAYQSIVYLDGSINANVQSYLAGRPSSLQLAIAFNANAGGGVPVIDTLILNAALTKQTGAFSIPSRVYTPSANAAHITESVVLDGFNATYHTYTDTLLTGTGYATTTAPTSTSDVVQPDGTLLRTFTWALGTAVASFEILRAGTTTDSTHQYTVRQASGSASA